MALWVHFRKSVDFDLWARRSVENEQTVEQGFAGLHASCLPWLHEREIALLFHRFAELQLPAPTGRGLDFGCGVGRLTQALARRMNRVVGADISPVLIDLARTLN